ncbi:MAG: hypothetical protein WC756_10915 [Taibaiella sp.]
MKQLFLSAIAFTAFAAFSVPQMAHAQTGNVGIGTTAPGSKLTVNGSFAANYNNITATTYTMQASDYYLAWNGSAAGTVTLPTALAIGSGNFGGRIYNIKNTSTTSSLTVAAGGTELIDNQSGAGVANISLPPGYYAMIINKGTTTGTTWEVAIVGNTNTVPCSGFGARVSGGSQSIVGGTDTKLLFPTEEWDQGGVFTPAISTFTAPQAGRYILTGSYKSGAASAANSQDLILFKNNGVLAYGTSIGSSTISNVIGGSVSYIANLAAGDVIDLRIFITAGATTSIDQASFSAIKTDCSGGTASGGSTTTGDYDWMKAGNVFPDSPGDTAQNIYHIGGNVGIGTNTPTTIFQAKGAAPQANVTLSTVPVVSQFLGLWGMGATNGTADYQSAGINAYAAENWTSSANGSILAFTNTPNGSQARTQRMLIDQNGNTGIFQNGNAGINPLTLLHLRLQSSGGSGVFNTNTANMALRLENLNNGQSVIQHFLTRDVAGATKEFLQGINPTFNGGNGVFYMGVSGSNAQVMQMDMVTGNVSIGSGPGFSKLNVGDNLSVGATYISTAAPAGGAIIEGNVGIGTTTPNADANLDLGATNKGLLLNRVALTAANNPAPLAANVAGMVVYNTATAGTAPNNVSPGMYYNDGVRWVRQPAGPLGLFVKSAGTQVWSAAATITDWTATTNDFGSAWNGSVFTVPAGMQGWYTISTGYQTSANGASARTPFGHVQIMVNGVAIVIGTASVHVEGGTVNGVAPGAGSAVASMNYYLNAGDLVSITGNHLTYNIPANTSTAISADPSHTYLSILKQ